MSDQILWINHAGFELRSNGLRLVCDPWLEGQVFNNGWALISSTKFTYSDFAGVDYIWFSHEHPDHFTPPNIKKIPEHVRRSITVLFQKTKDQRVVNFCRQAGFNVIELVDWQRVEIKPGIFLTCKTFDHDSFSFIETPERTYLNLNDCVPDDPPAFYSAVARRLGRSVDVLLTQFSYATWVGNPGDLANMRRAAAVKREAIDLQLQIFRPKFFIPFASFVWFCRPDNFHLNAGVNTISDIFASHRDPVPQCVVLYPGDLWNVGGSFPSEDNVQRYMADLAAHQEPLNLNAAPVSLEQLRQLSAVQHAALRKKNELWALRPLAWAGLMQPAKMFIRDLGVGLVYSCVTGLAEQTIPREQCHIEISSDSMADLFKSGYASDTLMVNGRFQEIVPGGRSIFMHNFMVARYNDHGDYVPSLLLKPSFLKQHLGKLISRPA